MALSNLKAGNTNGLDTSVKFASSQNPPNLSVNGLVSGSSTQVQFTVNLDPANFTCALSADNSKVVITTNGTGKNPTNVIYTVDTGINEKTATPGTTAVVFQVGASGQTGNTYTFSKSTGGGIRA